MIKLLSAMLAEHIIDSHAGEAIVPMTGIEIADKHRGKISEFPLGCMALINLIGGQENEQYDLSISISGPDVPTVDLGTVRETWGSERVQAVHPAMKKILPIAAGGLYEVEIKLNHEHLVTLPFFLGWAEF